MQRRHNAIWPSQGSSRLSPGLSADSFGVPVREAGHRRSPAIVADDAQGHRGIVWINRAGTKGGDVSDHDCLVILILLKLYSGNGRIGVVVWT
jgi:hypothetical protein